MTATALHRIGCYLDRDVWCATIEDASDLSKLNLAQWLVLIHMGDAHLPGGERERLANQLVEGRPLGAFFSGLGAEAVFDSLLHALDSPVEPIFIMTNFSAGELSEAVEEFFYSTWPAEERWEDWQGYLLVSLRGSSVEIEEAARPMLTD